MLPLKLTLHNFMCYGEDVPPLSFEGIPLACLCGDNGHGKSALLDAITWALWGRARAPDDALVNYGRQEMTVALEFAVGPNRYRALRGHQRPRGAKGSGKSWLELQARADGDYRALSGASLRETQEQINRLLHLDYETFVNSAFLRQGRADAFSTKTPGERKALLGEILGLSSYDELEQQARGLSREREAEAASLTKALEALETEVSQEETLTEEQRQIRTALAEVEAYIEMQELAMEDLREHIQDHLHQQSLLQESRRRLTQAENEMKRLQAQIEDWQRQIATFQAALAARDEVEAGYSRLLALRQENEAQNRALAQLRRWELQRGELELALAQARAALDKEQAVLEANLRRLQAQAGRRPQLEQDLAQAREREQGLLTLEGHLQERRQALATMEASVQGLRLTNAQLKEEMLGLKQKVDMLKDGDALCPLCGTELGLSGQEHIRREYQSQGEGKRDLFRANEGELTRLEKEAVDNTRLLQAEQARFLQESAGGQAQVQTLQRQLEEAHTADEEAQQAQERMAKLQSTIAGEDFAHQQRAELAQVRGEMARLAYHPEAHQRLGQDLAAHEAFEPRRQELAQAEASLERRIEGLEQAQTALRQWEEIQRAESQRITTIEPVLAVIPTLQADLEGAQGALRQMQEQRGLGQRDLGAVQEKMARLAAAKEDKAQKAAALAQAREEGQAYQELARAFGKDGIQALIIEAALPELEEEANRLLARLTDNRMHLKLETQRLTRKGEAAETLQIHISDELGTRPYETFSGGEAFRINFALRVALSRLLARRAGAPLPTLFIDEGFGTQDAAGRERLVEAINAIAPDFERIIVITHMEEIKEAFPVRIEVFKDEKGCRVTIT
ncbi:MAG: SMC family ATPase [Chloroflexi bacterium]|nr:SMC family ATPase [Chloroflexota bacterium]